MKISCAVKIKRIRVTKDYAKSAGGVCVLVDRGIKQIFDQLGTDRESQVL